MLDLTFNGITDTTLREGEQTTGVVFSTAQKLKIVQHLVDLGVEEIELGIVSPLSTWLPSLVQNASVMTRERSRIALWSRCVDEDINFAQHCNPDVLSLSIPVSDIHIEHKLRRSRKWVLETLKRSIEKALELRIPTVSVGFEDSTRADCAFLVTAAETAQRSGATRLRLADTVGIASPGTICRLLKNIQSIASISLGVHTHNDFGMATANAVAAIESGANWVDATVLGLGERAGNCRLEEIIGYLSLQKGFTRYRPEKVTELCNTVSEAANIAISPHHPIVGEKIFTCESGLHVHGLLQNPKTYEPYSPVRLGQERRLLFGCKTGKRAVQNRLLSLGVFISDEQADDLVQEIRLLSASTQPLVDEDLVRLAEQRIS